jgi:hypothetical protein
MAILAATSALGCSSSRPVPEPASSPNVVDVSADQRGDARSEVVPSSPDPIVVGPRPYRAISLSVGDVDVCVILEDHKVKCWGLGGEGELGYGDTKARGGLPEDMGDALPTVNLGTGRTAQQISVGHYGACALLDDGSVKCWGSFIGLLEVWHNQMGDALHALPVPKGRRVVSITSGYNFPIGVLDDGSGVVWSDGQAKIPDFHTTSRIKQLALGHHQTVVLFENGTSTLMWDPLAALPAPSLPFGSPAISVTGDQAVVCARLADGHVACDNGQQLFPAAIADTLALAMGVNAPTCALMNNGVVRCWRGDTLGCNVNDPGLTYWCDGKAKDDSGGADVRLPQPAVAIGAGEWSACALLPDGSVWCWGSLAERADPYVPDSPFQASQGEDESHDPWLGGTVAVTTDATGRHVYAGWRAIDLGTYR